MKAIILSKPQWYALKEKVNQDYPPSVSLVREKMKRVLGFTPRLHETWDSRTGYTIEMHLDFFDEQKRTMFLLKYSEYVRKDSNA
jgi:hypothetical protein